eukprot:347710_1
MMKAIAILFLFSTICVVSASDITKKTLKDGSTYEGQLLHGKMHGQGILIKKNGDVYEGGFKDNKYDGNGKLTRGNRSVYFGGWKDGFKDGHGKYVWGSGSDCPG